MQLRAPFLTLWQRASDILAVTGRPSLRDDDEAGIIRNMPGIYAPGVSHDHAKLLEALARAIARDQVHLDGLDRAVPTSPLDAARLLKCKCEYRVCAGVAILSLAEIAGELTRRVGRDRL